MKRLILGLLLVGAFFTQALAKESPEKLLRALPESVGTFKALEVETYDEPGLGASLGYNDISGIAITVYLYDLGAADIKDGTASEIIKTAKDQAIAEIYEAAKMGMYGNIQIKSDEKAVLELDKGGKLDALFVSLSYDLLPVQSLPAFSEIYVTGLKGQICKIRVSWPKDVDGAQRAEAIKAILSALAA